MIRGGISTVLAFVIAGLVLLPHRLRGGIKGFRGGADAVLRPLRIVHSGHFGDYVAWLTLGVAVIEVCSLTSSTEMDFLDSGPIVHQAIPVDETIQEAMHRCNPMV